MKKVFLLIVIIILFCCFSQVSYGQNKKINDSIKKENVNFLKKVSDLSEFEINTIIKNDSLREPVVQSYKDSIASKTVREKLDLFFSKKINSNQLWILLKIQLRYKSIISIELGDNPTNKNLPNFETYEEFVKAYDKMDSMLKQNIHVKSKYIKNHSSIKAIYNLNEEEFKKIAGNKDVMKELSLLKDDSIKVAKVGKRLDSFFVGKYDAKKLLAALKIERYLEKGDFEFSDEIDTTKVRRFKSAKEFNDYVQKIDRELKKNVKKMDKLLKTQRNQKQMTTIKSLLRLRMLSIYNLI